MSPFSIAFLSFSGVLLMLLIGMKRKPQDQEQGNERAAPQLVFVFVVLAMLIAAGGVLLALT